MKKPIFVLLFGLLQVAFLTAPSFAVWPPATSIDEATASTETPRNLPAMDRLEQDHKRLADVLRDLDQDEKDLRRQIETSNKEKK